MPAEPQQHVVLVTGSEGFSGRHLVDHLHACSEHIRVCGFDLRESGDARVDRRFVGDVGEIEALADALADCRPDIVMHLAGRMPPATDAEMWAANVGGTLNLLEAIRSTGITTRVLVIGSAAEYGPSEESRISEEYPCSPTTTYGRTKLAQTLICRRYSEQFALPIIIARPFNLFGPGMPSQTVIGEICSQIASDPPDRTIRLGNLSSARDFIDVRDAVAAYWLLAEKGQAGEVYNVCSGRATTVREVVDTLLNVSDTPYTVESRPERFQHGDVQSSCGDCAKLSRLTHWCPALTLPRALSDTLAWFRAERARGVPGGLC